MADNMKKQNEAEEIVTVGKSQLSDLWSKEDWLAIWIAFIIIAVGVISVLTGAFDFSAAKFATWGPGAEKTLAEVLTGSLVTKLLMTMVVLGVLFTIGTGMMHKSVKEYIPAYIGIFVLSIIVRFISAEFVLNRYLEWAFWALILGLLISNTVGVPNWLKPAIQTEYYIKTGLVIMGFSVLFSNIVNFGLYGLGIAWIVTPVVIIFMWFFGTRVLKMDNKPLVITLAAATSVCGTSAAIAVGAASKCKKKDLSMAVSVSIVFTVLMMVLMPMAIKAIGMDPLMGGALIGGTVDSTGAVTIAGTVLGEVGQTSAVLVKSIQNILIGFIAFAVAIFFTARVDKDPSSTAKVTPKEIWYRLPKFILGFFVASLVASFIFIPAVGKDNVTAINKCIDQYKNWAFVMAFLSIGLETSVKEYKAQFEGGKPFILYVVGQTFNIVLTYFAVWLLLSGVIFPIPTLV